MELWRRSLRGSHRRRLCHYCLTLEGVQILSRSHHQVCFLLLQLGSH